LAGWKASRCDLVVTAVIVESVDRWLLGSFPMLVPVVALATAVVYAACVVIGGVARDRRRWRDPEETRWVDHYGSRSST
jgi:hypothetical protein